MKKEYITSSLTETKDLAKEIAQGILKKGVQKRAFVIGLKGELGSGKTSFIQGFAKGLGIKEKILSPTFVIYRKFKIRNSKYFYHFDCYRIQKAKDILDLNFKEIISNPENIILVEWADKIKKIMPQNSLWIHFKLINESSRKLSMK
jgi:tRNA threonylcarbamoyladenosine biosynthesis protein TsaE